MVQVNVKLGAPVLPEGISVEFTCKAISVADTIDAVVSDIDDVLEGGWVSGAANAEELEENWNDGYEAKQLSWEPQADNDIEAQLDVEEFLETYGSDSPFPGRALADPLATSTDEVPEWSEDGYVPDEVSTIVDTDPLFVRKLTGES